MKLGDYAAYFSDPNNIVIMTAEEAGLGPEHYAGCDEACREIEAEPMSDEELLSLTNELRKKEGLPPLTWEELKGV